MESPGAPPKARSNIVFAIAAVLLLVVGLVAGYYVGRPPAPQAPGPVDGLPRANMIPRVDGWYRNGSVAYLDYGPQPNVTAPILVFFQAASPGTPVAGQRNVIDTVPGQPGYSDFWRVYKVLAPAGYVANSIRSFEAAVASGYSIEETDLVVNCPVVNPGTTIQGSAATPVAGWYRDREVVYFDHGMNSPAHGSVVESAPIYAFFRMDGTAVSGQRNVIDVLPGDARYSDLWRVVKVTVGTSYMANDLRDAASILAAAGAGQVTLEATDIDVNCPVVS
jgi:hypothetical protein